MKIAEIFSSISGEVGNLSQGTPVTFVRLAGCNLYPKYACDYCDTKQFQSSESGYTISVNKAKQEIDELGCPNVIFTGGEPLLQPRELHLIINSLLTTAAPVYNVTVETNGTIDPYLCLPPKNISMINWVFDYKFHLEKGRIKTELFPIFPDKVLPPNSWIKFVISNKQEYLKAKEFIKLKKKDRYYMGIKYAFSPNVAEVKPKDLINWMIEDKLFDVVLNTQIHKYIGCQ